PGPGHARQVRHRLGLVQRPPGDDPVDEEPAGRAAEAPGEGAGDGQDLLSERRRAKGEGSRRPIACPPSPFALRLSPYTFPPMLSLTFLGTGAATPTVDRNVAGLAVHREGDTILFDCG